MSLDQRVLMVLSLEQNGDRFTGSLSHPQKMNTDGYTFSGLGGGVAVDPIVNASSQNASIHIVVENSKDKKDTTEFAITLTTQDDAAVKLIGAPFDAWHFRRHRGADRPSIATDWDSARSYDAENPYVAPNAEMRAIFAEDQLARQPAQMAASVAKAFIEQDATRRERTRALLARGELRAGEDFRNAAFVFQHGTAPDDFLLAHTLALLALARGDKTATWIAAASLDRYLHSIGKPQIYGTQFALGNMPSQHPYNQTLISDALRQQLKVPPLAEQHAQFESFDKSQGASPTTKKK
jgi:hypothetical protein